MKAVVSYAVSLSLLIACVPGLAQVQSPQATPSPQPSEALPPGPNPNSEYRLRPDSLPQEGVPKGDIRGPLLTFMNKMLVGRLRRQGLWLAACLALVAANHMSAGTT